MPRRSSSLIPSDLRSRLEAARLDTLALSSHPTAQQLESTIRSTLDPDEAYNDIPGEAPPHC